MSEKENDAATLAGGCFWCIEAAFDELRGVERVESGYTGGDVPNPSYEQVCSGTTGHAEVVRVLYDPSVLSYRDLLEVFFTVHDPTTLNRQGADVGSQYRSAIFYHDAAQRETAEEVIGDLDRAGLWEDPIVTEVTPAPEFYPAEANHRDYYRRNPAQAYCQVVIAPKLAKLRRSHAERLRKPVHGGENGGGEGVRPYQPEPRNPLDHGGIAD
ncbi:MAG: peptide-methionine (S)-S-oxide reductase MsrA [Gemmatimonadota bacterium]